MKLLVQNNQTGDIELADVPSPVPKPGEILVRTEASAVSSGTERGNLEFARSSLIQKARKRPDLVRKVLRKARQEGVGTAYREAKARLDLPFPLGYSSSGVVEALGPGVDRFEVGERVACSGARYAVHAEWAVVPQTMAARVPTGCEPTEAAFAALGSVILHGLRTAGSTVGESVAIVGLGLLGLLGVQLAKAAGLRVVALDVDHERLDKAASLGADLVLPADDSAAEQVASWSGETVGADAVIIAATSETNAPLVLAAELARERGTLVLLGNFPPDLPRRYGYDKELTLRFSRAWGPGTYDPEYAERGRASGYPPSLVRWSASRNMAAYLDLVATGRVSVKPLLTHEFSIDEAGRAYVTLASPDERPIGIVITYPQRAGVSADGSPPATPPGAEKVETTPITAPTAHPSPWVGSPPTGGEKKTGLAAGVGKRGATARIGVVGAGQFATTSLLPVLESTKGIELVGIGSASGVNSWYTARKYSFSYAASDAGVLIDDPDIHALVIATRHDLHAELAERALAAGKDVWVEKPLALDVASLDRVAEAARDSGRILAVGFNRRYSPLTRKAIDALGRSTDPLLIDIRVNPGPLEEGHWVVDPDEGGGRLLAEGCHFFDLAVALAPSRPTRVRASETGPSQPERRGFVAQVWFADGSVATIGYSGAGPREFPREQIEAVGGGVAVAIDDFRRLRTVAGGRSRTERHLSLQKGFKEMAELFGAAVGGLDRARRQLQLEQVLTSSYLTLAAQRAIAEGTEISL